MVQFGRYIRIMTHLSDWGSKCKLQTMPCLFSTFKRNTKDGKEFRPFKTSPETFKDTK